MLFIAMCPLNSSVEAKEYTKHTSLIKNDHKEKKNDPKEKKNNHKHSYPVLPEDNKWSELSLAEQIDACNMPDDLIKDLSTDDLSELLLDYPFLLDILAFETREEGIEFLKRISNVFRECLSRDDFNLIFSTPC
jgi:hypothetical protein